MAASPDDPVAVRHFAAVIEGDHTEFIINSYENRFFIVITQLGKFGTMIKAKKDMSFEGNATYDASTIIGNREDGTLEALALILIELIGETSNNPLLLAVSLKRKNISPATFRSIAKLVHDNRLW